MDQKTKTELLRKYLQKIEPGIYDSRPSGLESMATTDHEMAGLEGGFERLASNQPLSENESAGLEAIVHKKYRPALFIIDNSYAEPPDPWTHFGAGSNRENIEAAILSVGRIELPAHTGIPFGGTGFVVGPGLIMTNRHVAQIFAAGLGTRNLRFKTGMSAGLNLRKERDSSNGTELSVIDIKMIHPYWDMALLQVDGLEVDQKPLLLSTEHTDNLNSPEVAVLGYPAQDPRNDLKLQREIFGDHFDVKRMQPGKLETRQEILSYGNNVSAITHDASTLGGNSGSAVIDVQSGKVLALHFAGLYLKANFAVPTFELAKDQRVVDAGVNFDGSINTSSEWASRWSLADRVGESVGNTPQTSGLQAPANTGGTGGGGVSIGAAGKTVSFTIPLTVTVSLGDPVQTQVTANQNLNSSDSQQEGMFGGQDNSDALVTEAYQRASSSHLGQTAYSTSAALTTAAASSLAYLNDIEKIERTCQEEFDFDTCKFLKQRNTECFVALNSTTALISFRGSQGTRDWIANMQINEQSTEFGMVHGGFLRAYFDIKEKLQAFLDESLGAHNLVLTGHSLGGAVATIAASEWRSRYPIQSIYTFGQPAVGDRAFRNSMERFNETFYRVVNDDDIVTKIPPGYKHVGRKIKLPPNSELRNSANESLGAPEIENSEEMISELEFHQLQGRLYLESQSIGTEGLLPSFSDHKIANYLSKLMRQSNIA